MKSTVFKFIFFVLFFLTAPVLAIDLSIGAYVDNYSDNSWQTDCYSYTSGNVQRISGGYLALNGFGEIIYEFTRSEIAKIGTIQFDIFENSSGDGSWVEFGIGTSPEMISYVNMRDYFNDDNNGTWLENKVKLQIPAGISTVYFGVRHANSSGLCYMDSLETAQDNSYFSAGVIQALSIGLNSYGDTFDSDDWLTDNYVLVGSAGRNHLDESFMLRNTGDLLSYRLEAPTGVVVSSGNLQINAYSENTDWFEINVYKFDGSVVYSNTLTGLGGNGPYTLNVQTDIPELVNEGAAEIEFIANGSGNTRLYDFQLDLTMQEGYSIGSGDLDGDGDVDFEDFPILAENWVSSFDVDDLAVFVDNWLVGTITVNAVANMSELKSFSDIEADHIVIVSGYHSSNDGGGGLFRWDEELLTGEDDGTIIKSDLTNNGRWIRLANDSSNVNIRWFGAVGDGANDDTASVQNAINYCKTNNRKLRIPAGSYRCLSPLDMTYWNGIEIEGDGAGSPDGSGVSSGTRIVSEGIASVSVDFSGCGYGKIKGVSFVNSQSTPKATVLLARTNDGGYGSDLTFRDCSFDSASVASVFSHSAEVINFEGCKFNCDGTPGFLVTGLRGYGVDSPFSELATNVSLTEWKFIGGEFNVANTAAIVFDGRTYSLSDATVQGAIFKVSGSNSSAIKTMGPCANVSFIGNHCEVEPGFSNNGLVWITGQTSGLYVKGNTTSGASLFGTGWAHNSYVLSNSSCQIGSSLITSEFVTSALPADISVGSNAGGSRFVTLDSGHLDVSISGDKLQTFINGAHGKESRIVYSQALYEPGSLNYTLEGSGWFSAEYAGDSYLIYSSTFGGARRTTVISNHDQSDLGGDLGSGSLTLSGDQFIATYNNTSGYFVVRNY